MRTQQAEKSTMEEIFGDVIYSYTRAQAIDDGVLVDLSAFFPSDTRLYRWPVACTANVWSLIEKACPRNKNGITELRNAGPWVWDLCWMSIHAKCKVFSESEHLFRCIIGRKTHILKANCGPGDDAEPVITIMLPEED